MGVCFIHASALAHSPFRDDHRRNHVNDDRRDGDQGEAIVIGHTQRDGCEDQPDKGRSDIEREKADQVVDGSGAALDDAVERARAACLVEVQGQELGMPEGIDTGDTLRILADRGKQEVAHLRKAGS